ncbi:MFS transporter [Algibacillus agarilyticus]|uniref:MFS transporter n=1 Tax=Algibacillus agarilyticus TaxID=2234133 RepID=UPI000DD013C7|nr:MFS transporter [Algibacillus agarilyticus]
MNSLFGRLSQTYFSYFAILGVVAHYFGLYLNQLGLAPIVVGALLAMMTLGRIIGPFLWASIADKQQNKRKIIQMGALCALIFYLPLMFSHHIAVLIISLFGFTLFWTAILPQLESITHAAYKGRANLYSRTRVWGSISFTILVVLSGSSFELIGVPRSVEWITSLLLTLLFLSTLRLPPERVSKAATLAVQTKILPRLREKPILLFLLSCFLLQLSFAAYYGFFSIYLIERGFTGFEIGFLIAVGVICEIVLFIKAGHLITQYALRFIFVICYVLTAFRWLIIGQFSDSFMLLVMAQSIHALSYGLHHIAAQKFIRQTFNANQQSRGQALYMALTYGAGGAIGSLIVGAMWNNYAEITFILAAILSVFAAFLSYFIEPNKTDEPCY